MGTKEKLMDESFFLFSMPSFIGGMASIMDIGSTLNVYNESIDEDTADYRAQKSDWTAIGKDIRGALAAWEKAIKT